MKNLNGTNGGYRADGTVATPPSYSVPVVTAPAPMLHFGHTVGQASNAETAAQLKNFLESKQWHGAQMPKGTE